MVGVAQWQSTGLWPRWPRVQIPSLTPRILKGWLIMASPLFFVSNRISNLSWQKKFFSASQATLIMCVLESSGRTDREAISFRLPMFW